MKPARADVWTAKWIGVLLIVQAFAGCGPETFACALLCAEEQDEPAMVLSVEVLSPTEGSAYTGAITIRVDVQTSGDDSPDIYARGSIDGSLPADPVIWSAVGVSEQTWTPPWTEPVVITLEVSARVTGGDELADSVTFPWSPP